MASDSQIRLQAAMNAVAEAYARLEQVAARAQESQAGDAVGWQTQAAQLETSLAALNAENEYLKDDNLRLANQLAELQQLYLALQKAAGKAVGKLDKSVKQLDLVLEA